MTSAKEWVFHGVFLRPKTLTFSFWTLCVVLYVVFIAVITAQEVISLVGRFQCLDLIYLSYSSQISQAWNSPSNLPNVYSYIVDL